MVCIRIIHAGQIVGFTDMANSNNWGEIYKSTWWGDKAWSANTLFIDSAPPGFGLNLLKGSEDLDNTIDWKRLPATTGVPTVSANTITDPNGGTTAERVDFSANSTARLQQRVTLEASKEYTFSVYAKVNTGTQSFRLRNVTLGDAEGKTATTSWTRFSYTFTTTTAGDYDLSLQNSGNTARTLEFWGAMLNEGATAGDYVKTEASVSGSAPAPAYSGFGDAFGGITTYYSLRQFTEAETLNAIRVRRSSDDTEQDIGFDANGDLDTAALLAFVGTGGTDNGFVTTFYDQSGNGNDANNATESEQPLVVSGGSVTQFDGINAIEFNGTSHELAASLSLSTTAFSSFSVAGTDGVAGTNAQSIFGSNATAFYSQIRSYDLETRISSSPILTLDDDIGNNPNQMQLFASINGTSAGNQYIDGTIGNRSPLDTSSSGGISETSVYIGSVNGQRYLGGSISEIIFFESDQSANRTTMETNINDHFDIYTP